LEESIHIKKGSVNMREIHIDGVVSVDVSHNDFIDQFIEWIEFKGWMFGGGTVELDKEGNPILGDSKKA
jgi:hypothetical protein